MKHLLLYFSIEIKFPQPVTFCGSFPRKKFVFIYWMIAFQPSTDGLLQQVVDSPTKFSESSSWEIFVVHLKYSSGECFSDY